MRLTAKGHFAQLFGIIQLLLCGLGDRIDFPDPVRSPTLILPSLLGLDKDFKSSV